METDFLEQMLMTELSPQHFERLCGDYAHLLALPSDREPFLAPLHKDDCSLLLAFEMVDRDHGESYKNQLEHMLGPLPLPSRLGYFLPEMRRRRILSDEAYRTYFFEQGLNFERFYKKLLGAV